MVVKLNTPQAPETPETPETPEQNLERNEITESSRTKRLGLMAEIGLAMPKIGLAMSKFQEMKESFWENMVKKALESLGISKGQAENFLYVVRGEPTKPAHNAVVEIFKEPVKSTDKFPFTLPVGTVVRKTGKFGDAREGHTHAGVDIAAKAGTPIIVNEKDAPLTVEKVSSGGNGGNTIAYKTANGTRVVLCHLQEMPKYNSGQQLSANAVIGRVGNTGTSTGPHIHMEIGDPGNKIDPGTAHVDETWFA